MFPEMAGFYEQVLVVAVITSLMHFGILLPLAKKVTLPVVLVVAVNVFVMPFEAVRVSAAVTLTDSGPATYSE